ncbi:alpha-L-arabinofuranosidase C-terminal domain-containing protein [Mucilaginibacter boryungensis]|uniref:non-reducing end alpha-L-arabinofuranosidase n=1 Tax=Mucilaginibacter boryungensis TaxID=768480 RepID=A0ABR9XG81_9SPHI|nr:alpha-L-arabinofuranosidase C-terminal domain-containing protein [Mucilaginibacter boryungensis]MBE9666236.1 alpha-L-arabinofuranosidase [Mucilaginibacter boryungensis]
MKKYFICLSIVLFSFYGFSAFSQQAKKLTVLTDTKGPAIPKAMWGIFFEDINFSADGGLYAELIKNRSFEFTKPLMGWKEITANGGAGNTLIINRGEANANNPRFARITVKTQAGAYGLANEGFRGMGLLKDKKYNFSILARKQSGNLKIRIEAIGVDNKLIGKAELNNFTGEWAKYTASFICTATDAKAHLNVYFEGPGTVDVDMASLFPQDTYKGRPNGLRADLAEKLAALKPGFMRFPGGCIVEGRDLANRYQWKKTVGDIGDRELIINRWNTEFANRSAPDYFQSYGLGFFEYFQLAEDIGAEPLPILNCGMACQYNTGEVVPLDQIDPFIQDALDLVEFANGATSTKWGGLRAAMGHPKPFNLKMMGVGNEQWDEQYLDRYKLFAKTLKAKYPGIKLITSSGPSPEGKRFDYLHAELTKEKADFLDEHYYQAPEWFMNNASRYDNYDRKGPKIFAGEYAAHIKDTKNNDAEYKNTWISALAEAAFMTGLERNADVVQMASYAPLLAHVDAWQWRPDLIWFDNLRSVGTPNYYVQQLYSTNKGTHVIPIKMNGNIIAGKDSLYSSASIDADMHQLIIKIVNTSAKAQAVEFDLQGKVKPKKTYSLVTLSSADKFTYNTLDAPTKISPVQRSGNIASGKILSNLEPMSVNVFRVSLGI